MHHLAKDTLDAYRAAFAQEVAAGLRRPYSIPYVLVPMFGITTLWLAIPHTKRPWVYHTRWLITALVVILNLEHTLRVSSPNIAASYASGTAATWGSMTCLNLLIWTRPQFEAARVVSIKRKVKASGTSEATNGNGTAARRRRVNGNGQTNGHNHNNKKEELVHVWQKFPENESFLNRLGWSWDLVSSFRGAGWNWSSSAIPRPTDIPETIVDGSIVDVSTIPLVTASGYVRCATKLDFVWSRARTLLMSYLLLDFLTSFMINDPYAILGPDEPHHLYPLPWYLASLPAPALLLYREIFSMVAILATVDGVFAAADLVQYFVIKRFFPLRDNTWMYASTYGSFSQVLDRGLAGMWGAWWHQTFRIQFLAPATWLIRHGYLKKGTLFTAILSMFISFTQSGLMHMSGSVSSMPQTKPWRPLLFFLCQGVGICIQQVILAILKPVSKAAPRVVCQASNFLFVLGWLFLTAPLFVDDLAALGLWLLEPVPVSLFRGLGMGESGAGWLRWDRYYVAQPHLDKNWFLSGLVI